MVTGAQGCEQPAWSGYAAVQELNPQPLDCKSNSQPIAPPCCVMVIIVPPPLNNTELDHLTLMVACRMRSGLGRVHICPGLSLLYNCSTPFIKGKALYDNYCYCYDLFTALYRTTCISQHPLLRTGGFNWSRVLLPAFPC